MKETKASTAIESATSGQARTADAGLDEKVAAALGDLSTHACAIDSECEAAALPAYVGDYLLALYGDNEVGIQTTAAILSSSCLGDESMLLASNEVVCRVFGMRRMDGDVYGVTTSLPALYKLGIEGSEIRAAGLLDGMWCHVSVERQHLEGILVFGLDDDPSQDDLIPIEGLVSHSIETIRPVRAGADSVPRLMELRARLGTEEWTLLLLRSYGFGGDRLDWSDRLRLLSRLAPLAQPGLRALCVCNCEYADPREISPYEVLSSELQPMGEGFPGSMDCAVVGGELGTGAYGLSMHLDGIEAIATGISLAAVVDGDELQRSRLARLFGPFDMAVRTPQSPPYEGQRNEHLGVNRCLLGELWHALRRQDASPQVRKLLKGDARVPRAREEAVCRAVEGMAKVLYPAGGATAAQVGDLLEFVLQETCHELPY